MIHFPSEDVLILRAPDSGAEFDVGLVTDSARTPEELKLLKINDMPTLLKALATADGDRSR
ncbi:hypothetical protein ACFYRN_20920 [Streptomyces sp. NPDC005227]|uniref:hypothetical protein n=1 Tax=unclassified Streptomyces TaxID=2593676 RepID=UPI00368D84C6